MCDLCGEHVGAGRYGKREKDLSPLQPSMLIIDEGLYFRNYCVNKYHIERMDKLDSLSKQEDGYRFSTTLNS